ncbi:hypothetical protein BDZ91DRAFT_749341 [Kalaharituber pfeilii]|nr:hypothetical protein BDZ91DRAFT_749341 [Kalaharituber pfeilii]
MTPLYLTGSNLLVVFHGKEFEELFLLTLTVGGIAAGQLLALFAGCSLAPWHVGTVLQQHRRISRVRYFTHVDNLIAAKYINEQGQAGHL